MQKTGTQGIFRGTSIVAFLTLVSRVMGFFRDMVFAGFFGATFLADAFVVAFRIPNLLRSIVAEGALMAAFVPVFTSDLKEDVDLAQKTLSAIITLLVGATTILTGIGIIYSPEIVDLFAPGFNHHSDKFELCVLMTRMMFPYIVFISAVAIIGGALTSLHIFGTAAMAQVVMNLAMIVGTYVAGWHKLEAAAYLGYSVLAGGLVQVLIQLPALKRANFNIKFTTDIWTPSVRKILVLMLPAIFGAAIYQVMIFVNTMLASLLEDGSVSWLFYADRIVQLPVGIYSLALATVLLPALSHSAAANDTDKYVSQTINGLRSTSFVIIPCSFGHYWLAEPLIGVLFERGVFNHYSTIRTAEAVRGFAVGLWGVSCQAIIIRSFLAKKDTITSTLVGLVTLAVSFLLSVILIGNPTVDKVGGAYTFIYSFREGLTSLIGPTVLGRVGFAHAGIALASSIATTLSFFVLAIILKKRTPSMSYGPFISSSIRTFLASWLMLAALHILRDFVVTRAWEVMLAIPLGIISFGAGCIFFRVAEFGEMAQIIKKKIRI